MYLAMIILLMGALPVASIAVEFAALHGGADLLSLIGKWFVFWPVGVRLILAGLRQVADPKFTAGTIFGVKDAAALTIVQELGFGNLSIGTSGRCRSSIGNGSFPRRLREGSSTGLRGSSTCSGAIGTPLKTSRRFPTCSSSSCWRVISLRFCSA